MHNLLVFIICSLLVGIDCVTDKLKTTFSRMQTHALLSSNLVYTENCIFRALNFQHFLGRNAIRAPPPPSGKGDQWPLVDTVGYSIQATGYFHFY